MSGRLRVGVLHDERRVVERTAPLQQEHGHRPAAAEAPNRDAVQERSVPLFAERNSRGLERPPGLLTEVTERDRDEPVGHAPTLELGGAHGQVSERAGDALVRRRRRRVGAVHHAPGEPYWGKAKSLAAARTIRSNVPPSARDVRTPYMTSRSATPKRVRGAKKPPARAAPRWHLVA